jgi:hypothetical protein
LLVRIKLRESALSDPPNSRSDGKAADKTEREAPQQLFTEIVKGLCDGIFSFEVDDPENRRSFVNIVNVGSAMVYLTMFEVSYENPESDED